MDDIKKYILIVEAAGRIKDNPDVTYEEETAKVIAKLKSFNSTQYTKLALKLEKISKLEKEIIEEREEAKRLAREHISDLFDASDAALTRVVDTVSFIFTLSKDPIPTRSFQWSKIVNELTKHLTPELILVLETIKGKFNSITQKEPSLKIQKKEDITESNKVSTHFNKFKKIIFKWTRHYDKSLIKLKNLYKYI